MLGFSLNNLSLFGLVLAIGIVVDDAIVVVENVERWMAPGPAAARGDASRRMDEITGPVIAITLVLSAVFVPTAFIPGISGQFYRQFALTIAASTIISAINAMTMAPARAVTLIKPHAHGEARTRGAAPVARDRARRRSWSTFCLTLEWRGSWAWSVAGTSHRRTAQGAWRRGALGAARGALRRGRCARLRPSTGR